MNYDINSSQKNYQKAISPEQLNQIIEAIADGRYSWACVLILRFVGYNPLHFIPQRTYSRLIKENTQTPASSLSTNRQTSTNIPSTVHNSHQKNPSQVLNKINDLDYLETFDHKQTRHSENKNTARSVTTSNMPIQFS
ncbi:HetP family heterocyst commitment protein [Fortiea contorta]|uniref:HetP family heterocyst commitment protein n=1 Tax=Fortiea contorta TaxID=1892405 RepID=UPI000370428B|nr:HetP family heterocyst commitment protein [Fortiea contorta]